MAAAKNTPAAPATFAKDCLNFGAEWTRAFPNAVKRLRALETRIVTREVFVAYSAQAEGGKIEFDCVESAKAECRVLRDRLGWEIKLRRETRTDRVWTEQSAEQVPYIIESECC